MLLLNMIWLRSFNFLSNIEEPISEFTEGQKAARRMARSLSSSRNAMLVISSDHKIVWFDSEFANLSGYSLYRLKYQDLNILFSSNYLKENHPKFFKKFLSSHRRSPIKARQMYGDRDIEILGAEKTFFAKITIHYFRHDASDTEFGIATLLPKPSNAPVTINNNYGDTKVGLLFDFANLASTRWKQLLTLAALCFIFIGIYGIFQIFRLIPDHLPKTLEKLFEDDTKK